MHTCDNRACVNPAHLFIGTKKDNLIDAFKKNRGPNQKITEEQVREIKLLCRDGISSRKIADRFGIGLSHLRNIRLGIAWGHIPFPQPKVYAEAIKDAAMNTGDANG